MAPPIERSGRGTARQSPARGSRDRADSSSGFRAGPTASKTPKKKPKKKKTKKKKTTKTHRAYGLPNANQIFLTMVVVGMLFVQLLRPNWVLFPQSDATAGLATFRVGGANDTVVRVAWSKFCRDLELPIDRDRIPQLEQPFASRDDALEACAGHTPELLRVLTATSIALSMLSVTVALYFHLGSPSQRQVVLLGVIPGLSLLATGVLGTVVLAIWQSNFGALDNGDCFHVAVASTVIAYAVAISMGIRWRWPGIFAVDKEQEAFEVRRNWRRRPPPVDVDTPSSAAGSPAPDDAFHRVV